MFGGGKHVLLLIVRDDKGNNGPTFIKAHAAHAVCQAAHRTNNAFGEASALARIAEEHDVFGSVGHGHAYERFALIERRSDDALEASMLEGRERRLLDGASIGGHDDEMLVVKA